MKMTIKRFFAMFLVCMMLICTVFASSVSADSAEYPFCGGSSYTYGTTKYTSYSSSQHEHTLSCSDCGYSTTEYGNHTDTDNNGECDSCGYGMSYFSVTVPAAMLIVVSENGEVTAAANANIINNSSSAVVVSDITIFSGNGWMLVPYDTNMANEKVNSNLIGFRIEDIETTDYGESESFTGNWKVEKGESLSLFYDAVVSVSSRSITDEQVLTVVFVIEWAE